MRDMAAAGPRNTRVSFQKNEPTTAGDGQIVPSWVTKFERRAAIVPRGGSERWLFEQVRAEIDHILHLDWDKSLAAVVPALWRVIINGVSTRTLNIDAIFDPNGERKTLRVYATEVLP